jgi:phage-related protein
MVRVLGDVTGLGKSFDGAASKGQGAAAKMHSAFSGVLGTLNQTGVLGPFGTALSGLDSSLSSVTGHAKELGPVMMGTGAAVAGVGIALSALGSKDQAAHQQLQAAVANTGQSYDTYAARVEAAIKTQEHFGTTADTTQDALRVLVQATGSPKTALDDLGVAADLAAAKHEDLTTAATQLAKASQGSGRILKEFGLTAKDASGHTKTAAVITAELGAKLKGEAAAGADTFGGKLKAMKAQITDQVSQFGQKYGPALTAAGSVMAGLGAATQVASAAQAVFNAVMDANPVILVVLAIAALVGGFILLYTHSKAFRDAIQDVGKVATAAFNFIIDAAKKVWDWISNNWPLLLGIITGPFGLAVYFVVKYWNDIWGFLSGIPAQIAALALDMWHWISDEFNNVVAAVGAIWNAFWGVFLAIPGAIAAVASGMWTAISAWFNFQIAIVVGIWNAFWGFFSGLPGQVASVAASLWSGISAAFSAVLGAVQGAWGTFWGWLTGIPGAMGGIFDHMWDGIVNAFKGVINEVIRGWNSLHFTTPSVDLFGIHTPSVTIGVPQIPTLAAGGLMTSSGLVFAHAGEVITPAPVAAAARTGPAVVVQEAHFHEDIDLNTFLLRAAWVARTRTL